MPTRIQLRRGNTAQTVVFTGAAGEVTVDTDKKTIVVHDGTTSGGTPLSTEANTGNGNIIVTNAYQANVGVAIASGQANTGAGLITVTNAYQANTGAVQIAKLDKAGGTITGNLTVSGITTLGNGAILGSPNTVGTMPAFTLGGTVSGGGNQINNVIIGTTTPLAGAFTTVTASGNISGDNAILGGDARLPSTGKLSFNGATASDYMIGPSNGIIDSYIGSSQVMRLNSTGLAVTGTLSSTLGANFATSSGSVGVGTASPQALLHVGAVAEAPGFGTTSQMCYVNGTVQPEVLVRETTNDVVVSMFADSTSGAIRTATNHPLIFYTNNTERARINAAGGLEVTGTLSATATGAYFTNNGVTTSAKYIQILNTNGGAYLGVESSAGGAIITGSTGYDAVVVGQSGIAFSGSNGNAMQMRLSSTGLAVTGTLSATGQIISTTGNNTFPLVNQTGTTGFQAIALQNTTGNMTVGVQGSDATALITTGATAFDTVLRGTPGISFSANSGTSTQMRLSSTGLAVTGTLGVTGTARFGSAGAAPNDFNVITSNVGGSIYTFDNSNTTAGTSTLNAFLRAYGASDVSIIMQTAAGASGQLYAFGIDNSDASSFVISGNTSLGTSNLLRLSSSGTLSGGISGTGYSFSGSAPATSLTLNSSGNLGIGTTSTLNYGAGGTFKNLSIDGGTGTDNRAEISLAGGGGGANYNLGRINFGLSSNTTNVAAGINGFSSASGASTGGILVFSTASDISVSGATERARFNSTGALVFAGGTTTADGIGITFPATQSASSNANTLDDYEEGTWTPSLGGFTSIAYSTQTGAYTKIGNVVNIVLHIVVSGGTRSGADLLVNNLPFTAASQAYSGGSWGYGFGVVASTAGMPQLRINNSTTNVSFLNTAGAVLAGTDLNTATPTIAFSATYLV